MYTESIFIVDDRNAFFTSFTFEKESEMEQKEQKRGGGVILYYKLYFYEVYGYSSH